MRVLTIEEMMMVSGGGGSLDAKDGPSRNTDFGPSRGPQTRGGNRGDGGRNGAMESYLGKDVNGANAVGLNPDVARGAIGGAIAGAFGGLAGAIAGAIGGAYAGSGGGWTSPSPSNHGGGNSSGGSERCSGGAH